MTSLQTSNKFKDGWNKDLIEEQTSRALYQQLCIILCLPSPALNYTKLNVL